MDNYEISEDVATAVAESLDQQEAADFFDPDATDAPVTDTPEEATPAGRLLSFTVVHGWLKGEHRCPFELHATGCRDLRKLLRTHQFSYEVLAPTRAHAEKEAASEHGVSQVWTQPCCTLKRMQAIGRA